MWLNLTWRKGSTLYVTDLNTWHGNEMIWFANENVFKKRKKKPGKIFTQSQLDLLWLEGTWFENVIKYCDNCLWHFGENDF